MPLTTINSTIFSTIFQKTDQGVVAFIGSTSSAVASSIAPAVTVLLSVYIMLWGWSMMRGVIDEPITDGITRIVRLSVITGIALTAGLYSQYVADWIWNSPDAIAKVVIGRDARNSINFLDTLISRFFTLANNFLIAAERESRYGIPDLTLFFSGISLLIMGVIVTGYAAFLFILGKLSLAILLGVGPIFIALAIFETTKKFLDSWIGQVLNYVFLVMLTAACVKIILVLIEQYFVIMLNTEPNLGDAMQMIAISLIGFLILMQMPSVASGLGGGVALSTLNGIGWAYSKIRSGGKSGLKLASGKTLTTLRADRKRKADMARWASRNPLIPRKKSRTP